MSLQDVFAATQEFEQKLQDFVKAKEKLDKVMAQNLGSLTGREITRQPRITPVANTGAQDGNQQTNTGHRGRPSAAESGQLTQRQQDIVKYLAENPGPHRTSDIANKTGIQASYVSLLAKTLTEMKILEGDRGLYQLSKDMLEKINNPQPVAQAQQPQA